MNIDSNKKSLPAILIIMRNGRFFFKYLKSKINSNFYWFNQRAIVEITANIQMKTQQIIDVDIFEIVLLKNDRTWMKETLFVLILIT